MAQAYAALTGGPTDIVFHDSSGNPGATWFKINDGWTPQVARLRQDELGGRGPYEDVVESVPITIGGSNAAHMYANAAALGRALDQSNQWYRNENVSAVIFKYSPRQATVSASGSPLQTPTWDTSLRLSPGFNVSASGAWMTGAQMQFTRNGEWLHSTNSASSASAANPGIMTVNFAGSLSDVAPIALELAGFPSADILTRGFLCLAPNADRLKLVDTNGGSGADYTNVADSANNAYGGSVLRYTPVSTLETESGTILSGLPGSGVRKVAILGAVRNNSATTKWQVRIQLEDVNQTDTLFRTRPILIDTSTTQPRLVVFGLLSYPVRLFNLNLSILSQASAVSGTLDFDYLVLVDVTDEQAQIIELQPAALASFGAAPIELNIDHQRLSYPDPTIWFDRSDALFWPEGYRSNLMIYNKSASLLGLLMLTNGASWKYNGGGSVVNYTLTGTRRTAYLVPV